MRAATLGAQSLPVQSVLGTAAVSGCSATPALAPVNGQALPAEVLKTLVERAQDASLQGDHVAARDAYESAAASAPSDGRIAYYLGREYEALRDASKAVQSYCRFLALSPTATDVDDVRGRVVRLTSADDIARLDRAQVLFRSGVVLLQRGAYDAADSIFVGATLLVPNAPAALYNRGLARAARGARSAAVADFRRYIALTPGGRDHAAIEIAIGALPRRVYDPANALVMGLLLPGLGQFRTGRPLLGIASLGAMSGAITLALEWSQEYQLVARRDPQGKAFVDSVYATVHPSAIAGYSAAAAIWLLSAVEARLYARRTRARSAAIISRGSDGGVRLVARPLSRSRTGVGLALRWP